jgi:hypothetical protein
MRLMLRVVVASALTAGACATSTAVLSRVIME